MNNIEKVKRQLAKPISIKIKNDEGQEDEFLFKRLNIEQQAIMMELSKKIQSRDIVKINGEEVPDLEKEDMIEMGNLVFDVVKNSMPDLEDETAKEFASDNFDTLSNALVDLMPKGSRDVDAIRKRREAIENAKSKEKSD